MLSQLSYTPIKPEIRFANFVLEFRFRTCAMLHRICSRNESRGACGASFSFLASSNRRFDIARKGCSSFRGSLLAVRHFAVACKSFCNSALRQSCFLPRSATLLEYGFLLNSLPHPVGIFCSAQWRTTLPRHIESAIRLSRQEKPCRRRFASSTHALRSEKSSGEPFVAFLKQELEYGFRYAGTELYGLKWT